MVMEPVAMGGITARLSTVEDLYFLTSFLRATPPLSSPACKPALLPREAQLFLDRYGATLAPDELDAFDALCPDYEVDWHLHRLRAAAVAKPPAPDVAPVRNRRRAYLDRLVRKVTEFYLQHEYLGRFQDSIGRAMARPGERWSETLMRCRGGDDRGEDSLEQIRRGVDSSEWVGGGDEVM